jgi:hypothetical protein
MACCRSPGRSRVRVAAQVDNRLLGRSVAEYLLARVASGLDRRMTVCVDLGAEHGTSSCYRISFLAARRPLKVRRSPGVSKVASLYVYDAAAGAPRELSAAELEGAVISRAATTTLAERRPHILERINQTRRPARRLSRSSRTSASTSSGLRQKRRSRRTTERASARDRDRLGENIRAKSQPY